MKAVALIAVMICVVPRWACADLELDRLREGYERDLRKLIETRTARGDAAGARAAQEELDRFMGQPPGGGSPGNPAYFVNKTWKSPTGTQFTFAPNGVCTRELGQRKNVGRWKHIGGLVVATTDVANETRYFRFVSATEGYYGNSKDDTKSPVTLVR